MDSKDRPKIIRDRTTELTLGVGLFLTAAWLIYDAYEGRGRTRPFMVRLFTP